MRHATYGTDPSSASIAILVKETSFNSQEIKEHYIDRLGINPAAVVAYSLWYDDNGKCQAALAKDYLQTLLHSLQQLQIKTILVTDATYYKYITESKQPASAMIGYHTVSKIAPYDSVFDVWYAPNFHAAQYNPKTNKDLTEALVSFKQYLTGSYIQPGSDVLHSAKYPKTIEDIQLALNELMKHSVLTADIETRSLEFWNAGIETIAFAWDKHNGLAFCVDRDNDKKTSKKIRNMLQTFLTLYSGKLIWHNISYDAKVLTYELWMNDLQDIKGMIDGIQILTRDFEDTKLIAYLASNNTIQNILDLKSLSAEYMGNYGVL
jgi:DNA polymerase-1